MTQPSPADQLRTAAEKLRDYTEDLPGYLQGMAEPVAQWLDSWVRPDLDENAPWPDARHALAVARAITGDTT